MPPCFRGRGPCTFLFAAPRDVVVLCGSSPLCHAFCRRGGHAAPVTGQVGTWLLQVSGAAGAGSPLGSLWELAPELCCGRAGHAAIQPERGRGSPLRRGRSSGRGDGAAPCCTAIRNMSGCQQPGRQLRDLAEGVPVSRFSSASHLSEPSVAVCPALGLPGGAPWLRPLSHGTGGTSPTSLSLQGSKTEPIRAVTPRPAQPADGAGVAPRPGRICKAFILQSSVTGAALQLLLSSGLRASRSLLRGGKYPVACRKLPVCLRQNLKSRLTAGARQRGTARVRAGAEGCAGGQELTPLTAQGDSRSPSSLLRAGGPPCPPALWGGFS